MTSDERWGKRPESNDQRLRGVWRGGAWGRRARVAATASLLLALAVEAEAKTPSGMVRYSHPVLRNGKLLLWHGAWRGSARYARSSRATALVQSKPAARQQAPREFSVLADPGDVCASHMAKDFAAVLTTEGAAGRAIVGSTSPTGLTKVDRVDMADFAVVTLDTLASSAKTDPEWVKRSPLVARLAPETLEVIAPREIKSIGDLQNLAVSFGDPDSATAISAKMLFSRLGISVNPIYEPAPEGLDALAAGKREAVVVLGARDLETLNDFGDDRRFHILEIPWSTTLDPVYAPARVTAAERPNLVAANSAVDTVGEPMALIALDAAQGSPRAEVLGRVARTFLDSYDAFLTDDHDSHWRDVNLAAEAFLPEPYWPRLGAAQDWLDAKKSSADASLDAFRASAKAAADANGGPSAEDSDRLYDSLTRWRGLMQ
jgi:hypothetical protein